MDVSSNEPVSYERLPGEPSSLYAKFRLYRNMQADRRSLLAAYIAYQLGAAKGRDKPYTDVPGAWKKAADRWQWKARAAAYDMHVQAEEDARIAVLLQIELAEKERILTTDYALSYKRIQALTEMAHTIEKSLRNEDGTINYKWLTPDKIREYRGCLDDIAKEVGERIKKTANEHTGKNGGPIEIITEWGGGIVEENEDGDGAA
jgi:hypothetical protein